MNNKSLRDNNKYYTQDLFSFQPAIFFFFFWPEDVFAKFMLSRQKANL